MAPHTPRLVVPVDLKKKPWEQKLTLHNRWHPNIPPVAEVREGELFRVEMVDWTGGSVGDNESAADVKSLDLSTVSIFNFKCVVYICKMLKQMTQVIKYVGDDMGNMGWLMELDPTANALNSIVPLTS